MKPHDLEKLLGGYATGTLTAEERTALFHAALDNQALFDALADEEALRDLLSDPVARQRLLGTLRETKRPFFVRFRVAWAVAGSLCAALVIAGIVRQGFRHKTEVELAAQRSVQAPPPLLAPEKAPEPAPREKPRARAEPKPEAISPAEVTAVKSTAAEAPLAVPQPSVLTYEVLRREADGTYAPAAPSTVFRAGDSVRIRVKSSARGYLTAQAPGAAARVLPVEAGEEYMVAELTGEAGEQRVHLALTREPPAAAAKLEKDAERAAPAPRLAAARAAGDARTEEAPKPPQAQLEIILTFR